MKRFYAAVLIGLLGLLGPTGLDAQAHHSTPDLGTSAKASATTTSVQVYNAYSHDVTVGVVIQNGWSNCTHSVTDITLTDPLAKQHQPVVHAFGSSGLTGTFTIPHGHTFTLTGGTNSCLQGCILSFGSFQVCPCKGQLPPVCPSFTPGKASKTPLVDGVNAAEFSVNPPSGQNLQESGDITCVNGCNSALQMSFKPTNAGPYWNDGVTTYSNLKKVSNSYVDVPAKLDQNCGRIGVFPYNLTNCINNITPPPCGAPLCKQTLSTCQFQRAASTQTSGFGGLVKIIYQGPLFPPS